MSIPHAPLLPLRQPRRWPYKLNSRITVMRLHGAHSAGPLTIWAKPGPHTLRWWSPSKRQAYAKLGQAWSQATAQGDTVWQSRIYRALSELWPVRIPRCD